jgi:diaminobutyrate-2-oxoglutarate transaminase
MSGNAASKTSVNSSVFSRLESNVRSYCRSFPAVFQSAKGAQLYDEHGNAYLDFFAGAGALNYGHNPDAIKQRLIDYLQRDGITHGLDLYTGAKQQFIETFQNLVLAPRGLQYKLQFCGPTGTNAVEAALKLARKVTQRTGVFAFMGGYHGMSLGALAATSNRQSRAGAGLALHDVTFMPFPAKGFSATFDTIEYLRMVLSDGHSGIEVPAAIIVEPVQAEGGINMAPAEWLQRLRRLCDEYHILLIADEIQVGCGRTGPFFAFERAGIVPDMVTLSKSISGYGLPMSLVLMKPELDVWSPGEHNGTFRGHQLAFVAAAAALECFSMQNVEARTLRRGGEVKTFLEQEVKPLHAAIETRGAGLIWGIDVAGAGGEALARRVAQRCFEHKLIIERAGRNDTVLKIMPPLTIEPCQLRQGLAIVRDALRDCLAAPQRKPTRPRAGGRGAAVRVRELGKTPQQVAGGR